MNSTTTSRMVSAISAAIRPATSLLPPCPILSLPALFFIFWLPASSRNWQVCFFGFQAVRVMFLPLSPPLPLCDVQKSFVLEQVDGRKHFPDFLVAFVAA